VQPNWFINRKVEFSLVETVANKKGFRRSEEFSLVETISQWKELICFSNFVEKVSEIFRE